LATTSIEGVIADGVVAVVNERIDTIAAPSNVHHLEELLTLVARIDRSIT